MLLKHLLDIPAYGAEIAVLYVAVDIDYAPDVVLIDDGHLVAALYPCEISEDLRRGRRVCGWASGGAINGDIVEVLHGGHLVLRRLSDDVVVHVILPVEEEHWRELKASTERVEHAGGNISFGIAALCGLGAVDGYLK